MEKETKKTVAPQNENATQTQTAPRRTNKTWEAFGRLQGSFTINDPAFRL